MASIGYLGPRDLTEEQLVNLVQEATPDLISVDTETVSLEDRRVIGVGIGLNEREAVYWPTWPLPSKYLKLLWRLLSGHAVKVFHGAMYDLHGLHDYAGKETFEADLEFVGPTRVMEDGHPLLACTVAMGMVQGVPENNLQWQAHTYLGMEIDAVSDILPARHKMTDIGEPEVARKCMRDCLATLRLFQKEGGEKWWEPDGHTWTHEPNYFEGWDPREPTSHYVTPQMKDCYQVDIKLIPLLMRMSMRGIGLRQDRVRDWFERLSKEEQLYEDICSREYFNPASPQQVGYVLAKRGNILPFTDRSMKRLKTDKETLQELSDPLAVAILKYREVTKLKSTYLTPWLGQERAFTHFRLDLSTARLASYDRNLQNIPALLREIFDPDSGAWSSFDFEQIELIMHANITQDPVMLKAYAEGRDLHAVTQEALWPGSDLENKESRRKVKIFNFALIFGATIQGLAVDTGLPQAVCAQYQEVLANLYPTSRAWMDRQIANPPAYIENIYGRKCRLPQASMSTLGHIQKCALAYPPQSSAAEIVKRAMLICDRGGFDQALQVHDEVLCDGVVRFPEELAHIHPGIHTPFKQSIGPNWG